MSIMRSIATTVAIGSALAGPAAAQEILPGGGTNATTIVLVHGAFAEASSWNGVIERLQARGYPVIAAANPLRSVTSDAAAIASIVESVEGPVVLVGHSYGGLVISNVISDKVKGLVYVAGFAPEAGESSEALASRFPGSTLGPTLAPVILPDGGKDLYIQHSKFAQQFAADVPDAAAKLMAIGQRPIRESALKDPSGAPAWKRVPSWFIFGGSDRNIPAAVHRFMADRAGSKETVEVEGASHVVMISHPGMVAELIEAAASTSLASQ